MTKPHKPHNSNTALLQRSAVPVLMFAVALVAALLRAPSLGRPLWFDEAYTANVVAFPNATPVSIVMALIKTDTHPPAHYLGMWLWVKLTGISAWPSLSPHFETIFRLPSLLMGAASAALAVPLARKLGLRLSLSILVGLGLAIHQASIRESTDARMYSALTLLSLVTWLLLLRAEDRASRRAMLLTGLLALLGMFHQILFALVIAAQLGYLLSAPERRRLIGSYLAPLCAFVVWLPVLVVKLAAGGIDDRVREQPGDVVSALLSSFGNGQPLVLFFTLLLAAGLWALSRQTPQPRAFLVLGLQGPLIACLWYFSSAVINTMSVRYTGVLVPYLLMLAAFGAQFLCARLGAGTLAPASLLLPALAANVLPAVTTANIGQEAFAQYAHVIRETARPGQHLASVETGRMLTTLMYMRRTDLNFDPQADGTPEGLARMDRAAREGLFLVTQLFSGELVTEAPGPLIDWMNKRNDAGEVRLLSAQGSSALWYVGPGRKTTGAQRQRQHWKAQ